MLDTSSYLIKKRFSSKKNSVYLAASGEKDLVIKLYTLNGERKKLHEYKCLTRARKGGLRVPEPITVLENGIAMEYIAGENLCDALNREPKECYAIELANWYSAWHAAFSQGTGTLLRGDGILKNFIWNGELWGIDFEEAHCGEPLADIGKTCASILNTDPMFTVEKINLCHILIERYEELTHVKTAGIINNHIAAALIEAARWRPSEGELLKVAARQIARDGLHSLAHAKFNIDAHASKSGTIRG